MVIPGDEITAEGLATAAVVRLTDTPEVIGELPDGVRQQAVEFVEANRTALLKHWQGEIAIAELLALLQRA